MTIPFRLYLITDRKVCPNESLIVPIEAALSLGIKAVQLREKDLESKPLLSLALQLRRLTAKRAKLFINSRIDHVLASGADGFHCPEDGAHLTEARAALPGKLIGKSVHSLEKAVEAEQNGAHFITFGPIFATPSKEGILEPRGLDELEKVARTVGIPVFALGGITPERAKECRARGAYGVAVIGALLNAENLAATVSDFKEALGEL